jgi:signal transduction histidine kinase
LGVPVERRAILIGVAVAFEGVVSVRIGFAPFEQRQALLALLTGWVVGGCGLLGWIRVPGSRTGPLLIIAAAAWFVGGFRWVDHDTISTVASTLTLLFAGVATHAVLTYPHGRTADRRLTVVIVAGYGTSLIAPPIGPLLIAAAMLGGLALAAPGWALDRTSRRWSALIVGLVFATALVAGQVLPVVVPDGVRFDVRVVTQVTIMLVAAGLTSALVREAGRGARVTDLVVDLDPSRGGLTRALASAIGDPTLEVGYWLPEQARYVDRSGRPVEIPGDREGRARTVIEHAGSPVAVLIHDPAVTTDPAIRAATARAAELAAVNARLQSEARSEIAAVEASRRRLLQVADEERGNLDLRLRQGIEPKLDALETAIRLALGNEGETDPAVAGAIERLKQTRRDLAGLTEHIHPRIFLDGVGLRGALEVLATRSPVPVELDWDSAEPREPDVQTAMYFVCSEALANVAKHADARRVRIQVTDRIGLLILRVEDDGRGGAGIGEGTGLQGVRDRLETLGGRLSITSPPDGGTRLIATLPVEPGA